MEWKYKIDLSDENVFGVIEKERGVVLSDEFKSFIKEANAATPDKYTVVVGNAERVVGAIFSFNKNEQDVDSVFTGLAVVKDNNLIPFAVDPFGNYFCVNADSDEVLYWEHESQETVSSGKKLNDFIDSLY